MLLNYGGSYCVNYTEGTYTNLDVKAHYIPRLYAIAYCFYLHTHIAWYCIKQQQQQNKSRTRENDVEKW